MNTQQRLKAFSIFPGIQHIRKEKAIEWIKREAEKGNKKAINFLKEIGEKENVCK